MKENKRTSAEIAHFCKALSTLLHAGGSLGDGLFFLAEEEDEADGLLKKMGQEVDAGVSLFGAMEMSGQFPAYVTGMVKVGEYTGHLEEALSALSAYYEEQERLRRHVRSVLTYPLVLFLLMVVVIGVMLIKVLPVFDEVYAALGSGLTGVAGWLLQLGQLLKAVLPVLGIILTAAAGGIFWGFANEKCRKRMLNCFHKLIGDRGAFRKLNDAHFAQALAMGYRSGLTVQEAVQLCESLLQDVPSASARCRKCEELFEQGMALPEALHKTGIMTAAESRILEVGLKSGNGETVMTDIAERMAQDAAEALEQSAARIEPAMVLTASLMVGVILLTVMIPLMNIMSAIG